MRINYNILQEIAKFYGSNDFQIEARYDKFTPPNYETYVETYIMLRFGYWAEVDLIGLEEILNPIGYKIKVNEIEDGDTGYKYSYHIKNN